jgi:hypothetical protein
MNCNLIMVTQVYMGMEYNTNSITVDGRSCCWEES